MQTTIKRFAVRDGVLVIGKWIDGTFSVTWIYAPGATRYLGGFATADEAEAYARMCWNL